MNSMCGIAGFHLAPEVAELLFDDKTAYSLAVKALETNAHRGRDAAGLFAVQGELTTLRKQDVNSGVFVSDILPAMKLGKPNILAVHTRAATKGKKEDNVNNHPVQWGDVLVTHNGMIHNDEELKRAVKFKEWPHPEVDTGAIAAVLNQAAISPELEFENVIKALSLLQGSFAIHAVWKHAPGYSLLARGTGSPLHIFYDDMGIALYSSEAGGVRDLMSVLGLEGEVRSVDPRVAILLHNGVPVRWSSLPDNSETDVLTTRLTPGGESWVESTRKQYYAAQGRPYTVKDDDKARIVLCKGEVQETAAITDLKNFANSTLSTRTLPTPIPAMAPMAALAEADTVFRFSPQSGLHDTLSVWYGDVEVLVDAEGKLLDVFNWSSTYDRFRSVELQPVIAPVKPFPEWFKLNTTMATSGWTFQRPFQKAAGQMDGPFTGFRAAKYKTNRADGLPAALFENVGFMSISAIRTMLRCKREKALVFLLNEKCPVHGQFLQNHVNPNDCEFVQMATLAALDKAPTITTLLAMIEGHAALRTYSVTGATDGCKVHSWWNEEKLNIPIRDGKLINVQIPFRDKCRDCDFIREVTRWPTAITNYIAGLGKALPYATE